MNQPGKSLTMSAKQLEIRDLLMCGLSNKEVSRELGLSPRTVEWHRTEILRKMEVKNVLGLMRKIYEARIAELTASMEHDGAVVERAMAAIENRWPR